MCFTGNIILSKNDTSSPFSSTTKGIDEGQFEQGWIVDYYRAPFDNIFESLEKNNGKVVRTGKIHCLCIYIFFLNIKNLAYQII